MSRSRCRSSPPLDGEGGEEAFPCSGCGLSLGRGAKGLTAEELRPAPRCGQAPEASVPAWAYEGPAEHQWRAGGVLNWWLPVWARDRGLSGLQLCGRKGAVAAQSGSGSAAVPRGCRRGVRRRGEWGSRCSQKRDAAVGRDLSRDPRPSDWCQCGEEQAREVCGRPDRPGVVPRPPGGEGTFGPGGHLFMDPDKSQMYGSVIHKPAALWVKEEPH
ncbi:hypothetical protein NDU88_011444 [Pleurodeles waltl]|uniref:Uncharacterized protein n=1 Tax=Pleurodeles waltl TaxID=8319 RepID=A0AAV7QX90_PLEWA|nr:hypothetical protein NDU88_011444 [Pleurodeles waltl]